MTSATDTIKRTPAYRQGLKDGGKKLAQKILNALKATPEEHEEGNYDWSSAIEEAEGIAQDELDK